MKILINGVIANVVERRRCQWVLTNQDRSEVLGKYVLCVYFVYVFTVCMCKCVSVCLYILFIVFSTKNVHVSDSHISTTPASIQGLKVDNLNSIWEHFKNPKKMLQFSIFHFYSGARKKSGQYWYGHHMIILEEHKNPKKVLWFFLLFTSLTLFRGWEWTILVVALQRLLKKPPQTHIMYVFMCADQSRWIGRITEVCTLYATHFGSVTFSS